MRNTRQANNIQGGVDALQTKIHGLQGTVEDVAKSATYLTTTVKLKWNENDIKAATELCRDMLAQIQVMLTLLNTYGDFLVKT
jgi:hypothetical protein